MTHFVVFENYADCSHVIGLGESEEDATREPLDNGFAIDEMIVEPISEEQYKKYLDLYT